MNDLDIMRRTLELAAKGRGNTSPNPLVGAVIVKNGKIISEGFHARYGDKHAEAVALDNADESVDGATLYCNLEPCSDKIPSKKTPPCTDLIIKNNIKRVVIAARDPNPYVNGDGIKKLRQAGIEVEEGILSTEANLLNEKFNKFIKTGFPFIHLKIAQSIDGRIATMTGNSKWITNGSARKIVHQYRAEYDAVLVGKNTAFVDDPSLNVRDIKGRDPLRIVLDENLELSPDLKLFSDELAEKTIVYTTEDHSKEKEKILTEKGVKVFTVPSSKKGQVDIKAILKHAASIQIASILVEGGSQIFTNFIKYGFFDKISLFLAPMFIGNGISSIGHLETNFVDNGIRLKNLTFKTIDDQILIEGYPILNGKEA